MTSKVVLGLRGRRQQVRIAKPNGSEKPELVRSHPEEDDRRSAAVAAWGSQPGSPRRQSVATIDEPLSRREQTILSHRLPASLRSRLETGVAVTIEASPRIDAQTPETAELPPSTDED